MTKFKVCSVTNNPEQFKCEFEKIFGKGDVVMCHKPKHESRTMIHIEFTVEDDYSVDELKSSVPTHLLRCFNYDIIIVSKSNIDIQTAEKCKRLYKYVTSEGLKLRNARESISTVWHKKIAQWLVIIESDGSMSDFYLDVLLSDFTVVKVHCHNNDVETIVCKDNNCLDALLLYIQ